jgi:putative hemolysin
VAPLLVSLGVGPGVADEAAVVLSVLTVTFVTLILGELVPKQVALRDPEGVAARMAKPMLTLSSIATPFVHLLSHSTDFILRLLPRPESQEPEVTEEEIRGMIAHATEVGILEATEKQIMERLFRLSDMTVDMIMTPREKVVWLEGSQDPGSWRKRLGEIPFARYPVAEGDMDNWQGYVKVQDLLGLALHPSPGKLNSILRKPHTLPSSTSVFSLLELFQWSQVHMALITDDEDRVLGIVTLYDVLEGMVGNLEETREKPAPEVIEREDGSWLVDGLLPFQSFLRAFDIETEEPRAFTTVHAFVVERLNGEPRAAASFHWKGFRLEVVDMDGSRVDKVLVQAQEDEEPAPTAGNLPS